MDFFTALLTSQVTGWSLFFVLLAAVVFGLLFGKLYTSRQLDSSLELANRRGDDFREAYYRTLDANKIQSDALKQILVVGETMTKLLDSLPPAESGREDSGTET